MNDEKTTTTPPTTTKHSQHEIAAEDSDDDMMVHLDPIALIDFLKEENLKLKQQSTSFEDTIRKLEEENKELRATTKQQSISINQLNEQINENPNENNNNSRNVSAVSFSGTTIDFLKLENERLNQKSRNLIQQNRVHERTIKELEEKMSEICDAVVDQQINKKRWQAISSMLLPGASSSSRSGGNY